MSKLNFTRAPYVIARVEYSQVSHLLKDAKVVFITDPDFPRNKEFMELMALTPDAMVLNFYTMDVEELTFIAKYRVLPAYTILFMRGQKVVGRLVNKFPTKKVWKQIVKDIEL